MKPVVVDTSVWVDWLRGDNDSLRERSRNRVLFMPAPVALELRAGAQSVKAKRVIDILVQRFARNGRLMVPKLNDFMTAGNVLARLRWPASKKANDVLIAVCARTIGAELWTANHSDFVPLGKALRLRIVT